MKDVDLELTSRYKEMTRTLFEEKRSPVSKNLYLLAVDIYVRDLQLNLPGGRWRQSLGEAGPHQVSRKKGSDKNIPMLSNIFIFILRRGPKIIIRIPAG